MGLSRIIADLLDPKASHGQGTLFLKTLLRLEGLKNTRSLPKLDGSQKISVVLERRITAARRIDISIEIIEIIAGRKTCYCLAIENKPFAGDQKNQVKDYLTYLREEYFERFLLIYLSGSGEGPPEWSIHETELGKWKDCFAIMPYCGGQEEQADRFDDFRIPRSLTDWFEECRKNCEVCRLRWFLLDAETFCRRTFGGQSMITSSERKAACDFVVSNPSNLETALAVYESWQDVIDHVSKKFLKELRLQIETSVKEKLKEFAGDMRVCYKYGGKAVWKSYVYLNRECWTQYPEGQHVDRRTSIMLVNAGRGPYGWGIGVCSPMNEKDMPDTYKKLRQDLDMELMRVLSWGKRTDHWPRWMYVDEDKRNWNALVPALHEECEKQSGEITRYFVDKFTEIAKTAIPIINEIECCTEVTDSSHPANES